MARTPRDRLAIGLMDQWVTLEQSVESTKSVSSLTSSGGTATAVTSTAHGFETGDDVDIQGATQQEYNGRYLITVVNATTFTYPITGAPVSPATGTITAMYTGDRETWTTVDTIPMELTELSGAERIQAAALKSGVQYRGRTWYRSDLTSAMRLVWDGTTLEILGGPIRIDGRPEFVRLELGAVI